MLKRLKFLSIILLVILAVGLTLRTAYLELMNAADETPGGTILIWHGWDGEETLVLQEIVNIYTGLNSGTRVVLAYVDPDELLLRFQEAAEIGFGPDLLIGPGEWLYTLTQTGLILPIEERLPESIVDRFLPVSLDALRYQDRLYGLPLSIHTMGLFYNPALVESPATTLDELIAHGRTGVEIGIGITFENAFWGIRTFGGRLFDEEGRAILDQGGFANWLNWLRNAQEIPGFILSSDQNALRSLFAQGRLGYLVDSSRALPLLEDMMDTDQIGVTTLPAGPTGSAAPFLRTEALYFSASSSGAQTRLAINVASFLTNIEQQTALMRQTGRIPANTRVRINVRLLPTVAAFAAQARAAIVPPIGPATAEIFRLGSEAYTRVLEGLATPAEAAVEVTQAIDAFLGFEVTLDDGYRCQSVGDFTLWHSWDGVQAEALAAIVEGFRIDCPNIFMRIERIPSGDLLSRMTSITPGVIPPDLLLLPHSLLLPLQERNLLRQIGPLIANATAPGEPDLLQRYQPVALDAFRIDDLLYGLPVALHTDALIYRRDQVQLPARTLADLLTQSEGSQRIALERSFLNLYWGIPAFGGQLVGADGIPVLDQTAYAGWLTWLQNAAADGTLILGENTAALNQLFVDGDIAYRVAPSETASRFVEILGGDIVGVATLLGGPEGEAGPLITVDGFAISSRNGAAVQPALDFIRYATRNEAQRLLVEIAPTLPANATVDVSANPLLSTYMNQLNEGVLYPNAPGMTSIVEFGGDGYIWVQSGLLSPDEAAAEVAELIEQARGISPVASNSISCSGSGRIQLWTIGLADPVLATLTDLTQQYNALCAQITIEIAPLAESDNLLAALDQLPAGEVALLLAAGRWSEQLASTGAIAPVDGLIDAATIRRILPTAVESVTVDGSLYALPLTVETTALYVNRTGSPSPATTLDGLLTNARIGQRAAIFTGDESYLWGLSAFSGLPGADEAAIWPQESALLAWFRWLEEAQRTSGMIFGDEDGRSLALFTNRRLTYYSGGPNLLPALRQALGDTGFEVLPLPGGPGGAATPLLESWALYFPARFFANEAGDGGQQAARSFANFLIGVDAQSQLMTEAAQIPVNRLVSLAGQPHIARFLAQAETALPYPSPAGAGFLSALERISQQVLDGRLTPEEATTQLLASAVQSEEP
ncbi:MAG: extracellular solute-binding protein [Caldilineaceae bacterium]|nr:extracellular solute-binding protein [Caldilineaceae bacterium]